jgi:hypothetical protein
MTETNENPGIPVVGSSLVLPADDPTYLNAKERFGATHKIEVYAGTTPLLSALKPDQTVCWGDGKSYHFRLTENPIKSEV